MQRIRNIVIWMSEACNLNCTYCYEHHEPKCFQSNLVKDRIVKLFANDCMDWNADSFHISFFGGEPLLEFEAMQDFISWLEANVTKPFDYGITTNGTLITPEIAQYLADKKFGMLFSIDGDRDAMIARSNSYDASIAGWQHLKSVGMNPEANMTFRPDQLSRWRTNIEHIIGLGFKYFNLNPLDGTDYDFNVTLDAFRDLYWAYINEWMPQGIRTSAITKPFQVIRNGSVTHGCGAGKGFIAISPDGEVYPCHHMVQINSLAISSPQGIDGRSKGYWESFDPKKNEVCVKCIIRSLCQGPCAAINAVTTGDLHLPSACTFNKAKLLAAQEVYCQCTEQQIQEVIGNDIKALC